MAIQGDPNLKGLAVIITNDYRDNVNYKELEGTFEDGRRLEKAFKTLKFNVHWKTNVTAADVGRIIYELSTLNYESVKHYRCIAFVFSGHGERPGKLVMQDSRQVDICNDIIAPILPGRSRMIGAIPKIFIIDACRGQNHTETVLVPQLVTGKGIASSASNDDPEIQTKGGLDIQLLQLPSEGNFLVAHSTLPGCVSNEYRGKGSLWLEILANKLPVDNVSVEDLLTDVNEELQKISQKDGSVYKVQQPEKLGRLNKRLYLLGGPDQNDTDGQEQLVMPPQHQPLNPPTNSMSRNLLMSSQRDSQVVPSDQSQSSQATQTTAPIQPTVPTQSAIKSKGNGGDYCNRLKDFTRPQFSYISQQVTPTTKRHRCTIKYVSNGQKKVEESDYYPSKKQAAERAAKKIFKQEQWPFERV